MNDIILPYIVQLLFGVIGALLFFPLVIRLAPKLGLVDQPNAERKIHTHSTPLIGGVVIVATLLVALAFNQSVSLALVKHYQIFAPALLIFSIATWDDRVNLSPKIRLVAQLVLAFFIAYSGIRIESLSGLFGVYELPFIIQYVLTIIVITGVVNAFNLIDGVNGLAGSLALINSVVLAPLCWLVGLPELALVLLLVAGVLVVFLKFNSNPAKVFMGDGGSMMLGFMFAVIAVKMLQMASVSNLPTGTISLIVLTLFLVPVIDAVRVFLHRFSKGESVLNPDKSHLHHLVLTLNASHGQVVKFIATMHLFLLVATPFSAAYFGLTATVIVYTVLILMISKVLSFHKTMVDWQGSLKQKEIIGR
jgi:UDP-GlcNAc:undecaprenyl-phosphate GlcNAc-1-phosphate transferase